MPPLSTENTDASIQNPPLELEKTASPLEVLATSRSKTRVAGNERHRAGIHLVRTRNPTYSGTIQHQEHRPFVVRIVQPDSTGRNATWPASPREGIICNFRNVLHGSVPADHRPNLPISSSRPVLDASAQAHTHTRTNPRLTHPSVLCLRQSNYPRFEIFSIPASSNPLPSAVIRTMKIATRDGAGRGEGRVIGLMEIFRRARTGSAEKSRAK